MPKQTGYILRFAATHFSMAMLACASFIILRFAFHTYFLKGGYPWSLHTSAFAPLSRTFRKVCVSNPKNWCLCIKKHIFTSHNIHSYVHIYTIHIIFRNFRRALLLSRSFANQHFPFTQALQINPLIKVNVVGFFRSSNSFLQNYGQRKLTSWLGTMYWKWWYPRFVLSKPTAPPAGWLVPILQQSRKRWSQRCK